MIYLCGVSISKITLNAIQNEKSLLSFDGKIEKIKLYYKILLEISALIYYIFLPIPILLLFLLCGTLIYLLFWFDVISLPALAGILIITFIMASAIFKSIIFQYKSIPDQFLIEPQDAPKLHALCKEISDCLNMKPIDSIYFDGTSSISVFNDGRILSHFFGKAKQCLVIGIGSLKNLSVYQLKSILAHEFGHLCKKDTAGGSFALFVRRSIDSATKMMQNDLVNHWYNPTWLYISFFKKVFLKISQGAARLQELMADDLAAELCGSEVFLESLLTFSKSQIEFNLISKVEFMDAMNNNAEPRNVYRLPVPEKWPEDVKYSYGLTFMSLERVNNSKNPQELIDYEFDSELKTETGPLDSHPSLKDRIANLAKKEKGISFKDHNRAEDLIDNIIEYQEKMTKALYQNIVAKREYLTDIEYQKRMKTVG